MIRQVDIGGRLIAIGDDYADAQYQAYKHLRRDMGPATGESAGARAVIEIRRNLGGVRWRALLGGAWVPGGMVAAVDAWVAETTVAEREAGCPSMFSGDHPYFAGLTEEHAGSAAVGAAEVVAESAAAPGLLVIDRAAFDRESSKIIFRSAGRVLATVLIAMSRHKDVTRALEAELAA